MEGAWNVDPDVICLAHGGPFAEPEDTRVLYERTDAQGFVGASSIERIPIEKGGDDRGQDLQKSQSKEALES